MLKKKIYKIIIFFTITFFIFLFLDLIFGKLIFNKLIRKNFKDSDTSFAIKHAVYHHAVKENYKTFSTGSGNIRHSFCSDKFGFRISCKKNNVISKNIDIAFIGDSQTSGFNLDYEDTFVFLFNENFKNLKISNLALPSYSPAIYYSKINYLIKNNFKFKEIIVFLDLSDIHDDNVRYYLKDDTVKEKDINFRKENYSQVDKTFFFLERKLKLTTSLIILVDDFLIKQNFKKKRIPDWVDNNPRSGWTYNYEQYKKKFYNNIELNEAIQTSIINMNKLYELLKKNNIKLSIAVYPWPETLKNDVHENIQKKIWEEFCKSKCEKFINLMDIFFEQKKIIGYHETYLKFFIYGDIHINKNSHKLIASQLISIYKKSY